MITVKDFAAQNGCSETIVYRHIRNHKEALGDRVQKAHGKTWLTDDGADYIRGLMTHAAPAVSDADPRVAKLEADNEDLRRQLDAANAAFQKFASETAALLTKASEQILLAEKSEANQQRADALEAQNADLRAENEELGGKVAQAEKTAQKVTDELTEIKGALDAEKKRKISFREYWRRRNGG